MFCTNCGNTIKEGAKFCQYCGKKTVLAVKDSMMEETVPNYPGAEYTVIYSPGGKGESRVEKLSDGGGMPGGMPDGSEARDSAGGMHPESSGEAPLSQAEYTSRAFNSPVLGVAGLKEDNSDPELPEEEEDDGKGKGILIALIVILILLILLVGFSAFAYLQGLIDF